jgi:peptide-methionine (R)-S-oxide reductase
MFKFLKKTNSSHGLKFQNIFKIQTSTFIGSKTPMSSKNLTEEEWKVKLSPAAFKVLRLKGTEKPGTGEYDKFFEKGVYNCGGCGTPLYTSEMKFNSGCGWPAFFDAIPGALTTHTDTSFGMERIEIMCKACGGHLGHIFKGEGFKTPTDERHCVNSISIKFQKEE